MTGPTVHFSGGGRICPSCHCPIPAGLLACNACAQKRAFAAALAGQHRFIPHVLTRRMQLRLWRLTRAKGPIHIGLFNYGKTSFCGEDLNDCTYSRFEEWDENEIRAKTCFKCFETFSKLVAECQAAAQRTE